MVLDDTTSPHEIELWLADDRERRQAGPGAGPAALELYGGTVARTPGMLLRDLEDAFAAGAPPDVVLLDDRIESLVSGRPERTALLTMRQIASAYGEQRPVCVLMTAAAGPTYVYAFRELGGHHYADRSRTWPRRLETVRAALHGEVWTHRGSRRVEISAANARPLPYFEAECGSARIQALLGISGGVLNTCRSRLRAVLDVRPGLPDRVLAIEAVDAGNIWVPLDARHLLPAGHPEHLDEAFVAAW